MHHPQQLLNLLSICPLLNKFNNLPLIYSVESTSLYLLKVLLMTCSLLVREALHLFLNNNSPRLMISPRASFQTSQASWRHSPMPWCNSNSNNSKWWWWTWCKVVTQWWWISSMGNSKPPCLIAWAGASALITTPWAWWVWWDSKTIRTILEEWEVKVSEA